MLITRLAKILMCLALALFCLLVAYDNIADPLRTTNSSPM
jgi:predicted small integral membrane protein